MDIDRTICKFCTKKFTAISNCCRHEKHRCKLNPNRTHKQKQTQTHHKCSHCNKLFSSFNTYSDHQSTCLEKPTKKIIIIKPKIKSEPVIVKKTVHYIGDYILDKFQTDMGHVQGIDFLLTNFMKHRFDLIIDKAYLSDIPSDDFPMASKDSHYFRFVDNHGNLIDDPSGKLLVNAIINNIQNSILRISNILIRRYSDTDQLGSLYEAYDLGSIQKNVCDMMSEKIRKQLSKYLSTRIINPNHLFFKDDRFIEVKNAIFTEFTKQNTFLDLN